MRTKSEINTKDILMLWGYDPQQYLNEDLSKEKNRTHEELDQHSFDDAKLWSELLQTYPEIIPRTINHLNRKVHGIDSGVKGELIEWRNILENMSLQRLKKFLESDSERAIRLRQSTLLADTYR